MAPAAYQLIFKGKVAAGQKVDQVKKNLRRLLKTDSAQIDRLFADGDAIVKKHADTKSVKKYVALFKRAGAILHVQPVMDKEPSGSSEQPADPQWRYPVDLSEYKNDRRSASSRDTTAIVIFVGLICLLLVLTGYLVWKGSQLLPNLEKEITPAVRAPDARPRQPHPENSAQTAPRRNSQSDTSRQIDIFKQRGLKLARGGHYGQAEHMYRRRLELIVEHFGQAHPSVPSAMTDLALVLQGQSRTDEAEILYHQVFSLLSQSGQNESIAAAVAAEGLAHVYLAQGKLNAIDPLYLQAIEIWDRKKGPDNPESISLKEQRARLMYQLGRHEEAESLKRYVDRAKKQMGRKSGSGSERAPFEEQMPAEPASLSSEQHAKAHAAGAVRLPVSIAKSFKPVRMKVAARSAGQPALSHSPPSGIVREPSYEGKTRLYGSLELGTGENKTYHYALDLIQPSRPVMYFDRNQNGDLSDDGPPLTNQGRGIFATMISIPFRRLTGVPNLSEDYQLWFFTNKSMWPGKKIRFYSVTQMKGHVAMEGRLLMAVIGERGTNDADFTNDGIYLDLNNNGKIETSDEHIGPGEAVQISGRTYQLDITW